MQTFNKNWLEMIPKPEAIPEGRPSTVRRLSQRIWLEEQGIDKISPLNSPIIKKFGIKLGLSKKLKRLDIELSEEYKLLKFEFISCGIVILKE